MKAEFKAVQTATCGEHNKGVPTSEKRKLKGITKAKEGDLEKTQRAQVGNRKSAHKRAESQERCDPPTLTATTKEDTRNNEVVAD